MKALNSLREMCVVFGEEIDAVSVSDETQNPKQHLREAYTCRRAFANKHTFPRKKIRETAHIPFKPGHLSELQPVNAVNTKGQFFRASFGRRPQGPNTAWQAAPLPR